MFNGYGEWYYLPAVREHMLSAAICRVEYPVSRRSCAALVYTRIYDCRRLYFPMQKVEKIRFRMSSAVVSPVSKSI